MSINKTIQHLLSKHFPAYQQKHKQPLRVLRAIEPQIRCQTAAEGTSHYICSEDGEHTKIHHSCRNKGCTVCGKKRKAQWLETQKERLLNCEHYHVVTTIPHEYQRLWLHNRAWFIQAHFESTSETLKALLEGNRHQGKAYQGRLEAETGFISTLHTWGRSLNLHPHIHTLITAGGLTKEGVWKAVTNDYLLPVKEVKALYRGKFQSKIKALLLSEEVNIPARESKASLLKLHSEQYKKEWSVRIQEKYDHGKGVLIYLSRYLGSSPLKAEQVTLINHQKEVLLRYKSHRTQRVETLRLSMEAFLTKYLVHQAEPRIHSLRYYGLYASTSIGKRASCCEHLGKTPYQTEAGRKDNLTDSYEVLCSCCGKVMGLSYVTFKSWRMKNPLYKVTSQQKGKTERKEVLEVFGVGRPTPLRNRGSYNKTFERDKLPQQLI
jgi:hypothetical protein